MHVAILVTLYTAVISLITLLVQTINVAFPDTLEYQYAYTGYTSGMRFAVASLIIVFPVFIFLSWWNHRAIARAPELAGLGIRKWFSYLTLFLAGATIIGDLIAFLNTFLGGEITTRFVWKVLAVLVVSLFVFVYHLVELRKTVISRPVYRTFSSLAALLVIAGIVWSFMVMGSPTTQRDLRFDQQRLYDLQNIQQMVVNQWQSAGKLPVALVELEDSISGWKVPLDPDTKTAYEYQKKGTLAFELCATFTLSSSVANSQNKMTVPYPVGGGVNENWDHTTGRVCFERTIDPTRYPVYKPSPGVPVPIR